jgi:hypothetical protein
MLVGTEPGPALRAPWILAELEVDATEHGLEEVGSAMPEEVDPTHTGSDFCRLFRHELLDYLGGKASTL